MEKIVWKERKHKHVLSKTLYKLQQSSVLCDMIINTKTGPILVHRLVLYAFNEILYADSVKQCSSTATAADEFISKFKDFDSDVGLSVVKYLYTGDVMVDLIHMEAFCRLCKLLGLDKVISGIEGINGRNSNDTNEDEEKSNPEDMEDEGTGSGSEVKGIKSEVEDEDSNEGHLRNESMSLEESLMQQNSALVSVKQEPVDEDFSDSTNNEIASDMFRRCCMKCDKLFENKDAYCSHMTADHGLYICQICEWTDRQQGQLQIHMKNEHPEMTEVPSSSKEKIDDATSNNDTSVKDGHTDPSGEQLDDNSTPVMIIRSENGTKMTPKNGQTARFSCDQCNVTTNYLSSLKRHKLSMHSNNPNLIRCTACNMFFEDEVKKQEHTEKHHSSRFLCFECGKTYKWKKNYKQHLQMHNNQFNYKCSICDKTFLQKHVYEGHINNHLNINPHHCSVCGASFPYRSSLLRHQQTCPKEKIKEREPIECADCNQPFNSKNALRQHEFAMHSDMSFVCPICGKGYRYRSGLSKHRRLSCTKIEPLILQSDD